MEIISRWWVVDIDDKKYLLSYRNPEKLKRYLKKIFEKVEIIREGTYEDYKNQ